MSLKLSTRWEEFALISILFTFVFTSGVVDSLQVIFFPAQAESKGANSFEYGFVFAIYELVILISSPILGSHSHLFCPKTLICFGMILCGSSTILFGMTYKMESMWGFLMSCSVLRIFEAIGASSVFMGSLSFITTQFPHSVAMYSGIMDTSSALGSGIGPSLGASLYQLGGFWTPFVCVGGLLLSLTLLPHFVFPAGGRGKGEGEGEGEGMKRKDGFGFIRLLCTPSVLLYSIIVVTMSVGVTFVLSMLEPHLRSEGMTSGEIGLMFFIMNGVFAGTTPIWGWMTDRMTESGSGVLTLLGLFFISTASLLIGPSTFFPLKLDVTWTVFGMLYMGLDQGAINTSAFIQMLHEAKETPGKPVLIRQIEREVCPKQTFH